jgi:hypothetical protein
MESSSLPPGKNPRYSEPWSPQFFDRSFLTILLVEYRQQNHSFIKCHQQNERIAKEQQSNGARRLFSKFKGLSCGGIDVRWRWAHAPIHSNGGLTFYYQYYKYYYYYTRNRRSCWPLLFPHRYRRSRIRTHGCQQCRSTCCRCRRSPIASDAN